MKKILLSVLFIALFATVAIAAYVGFNLWQHEVFKNPVYETEPPTLAPSSHKTRVLVFSKTNSYRHLEAIPAAEVMFQSWSKKHSWDVFITENAAIHQPELLAQFDLIVWNNVTGDVLTSEQRSALKSHLQRGGKFLGLHGSGGNEEYQWPWFPEQLIKAQFIGHPMFPQFRDGILKLDDGSHMATAHMPASKLWHEEWYSFEASPRAQGVNVLLSVDEQSYDVPNDLSMGKDHPLVWHHKVEEGTVFYSSLGHLAEAYQDEDYRKLLEQASLWLLKQ